MIGYDPHILYLFSGTRYDERLSALICWLNLPVGHYSRTSAFNATQFLEVSSAKRVNSIYRRRMRRMLCSDWQRPAYMTNRNAPRSWVGNTYCPTSRCPLVAASSHSLGEGTARQQMVTNAGSDEVLVTHSIHNLSTTSTSAFSSVTLNTFD